MLYYLQTRLEQRWEWIVFISCARLEEAWILMELNVVVELRNCNPKTTLIPHHLPRSLSSPASVFLENAS